jgi:hypothetical protein
VFNAEDAGGRRENKTLPGVNSSFGSICPRSRRSWRDYPPLRPSASAVIDTEEGGWGMVLILVLVPQHEQCITVANNDLRQPQRGKSPQRSQRKFKCKKA